MRWDRLFEKTQPQLAAAARRAKEQIAAGQSKPMDYHELFVKVNRQDAESKGRR